MPRTPRLRAISAAWGVLAFGTLACAGDPPALEVGPVPFTEAELGVLGEEQRRTLADLAAFGMAVAEERIDELITPAATRDVRSILLQRLALELAADSAGVADEELRGFYLRDPDHELVVRHLVVLSERWRPPEHRDSARARAAEARARAVAGEPFPEVAAEYSDEPGAGERGGLLQPGREGSWVPEFWEAASSLAVGEVSPVVETEFGYHVIRLEERRTVPFEEVRSEVLERVMSLPLALGRADSWARARMAVATEDTAALREWKERDSPAAPLVRWPDSIGVPPLTAEELSAYVRSLPGDARQAALEEGAAAQLLDGAARAHLLRHEAEARGIAPSPAQRAAIRQGWVDRVGVWAEALGFSAGRSPQAVKELALQALGAPRQGAAIARSELARFRPVLRRMYPVAGTAAPSIGPAGG